MSEREIQVQALIDISRGPIRLFRNNTAMGWAGKLVSKVRGSVTLSAARPLRAGLCNGSSDTIGWYSIEITPEMVGRKVAVFSAVEFKDKTPATAEQRQFIEAVRNSGGCAGIAHSSQEAHQIFCDYLAALSRPGLETNIEEACHG